MSILGWSPSSERTVGGMLNHAAYLRSFSCMKNSSPRKLNPHDWILSRTRYRQPDSQPHRHAAINPRRAEHIFTKESQMQYA